MARDSGVTVVAKRRDGIVEQRRRRTEIIVDRGSPEGQPPTVATTPAAAPLRSRTSTT